MLNLVVYLSISLFQIEKITLEDSTKPEAVSHSLDKRSCHHIIMGETIQKTKRLFETSLYSVTLKMIYINFSIAFG